MTKSENQSLSAKTKQSLLWYTTVPFTMHFLRFANSILLARLLLPSDFGIIGIITIIMYYCDTFSNFGFAQAIIQKKKIEDHHYYSFFSFNITVSLLFFLSIQLFSNNIADYFAEPALNEALKLFAFMFLITACNAGPMVKLKRELKFKQLAIIDSIKVLSSMSISLTLALKGYGFWSIIYAMLASQVIAFILTFFTSQLKLKLSFQLKYLRELLNFSLWSFIGGQVRMVGDSIDRLMIGKILGTTTLGFYDKAIGLALMPNEQLSSRLSNVSFSSFSKLQEDPKELENYFSKIVFLNSFIMIPLFIGLISVAKSFTLVLLGEKWLPMVSSLEILAMSYLFVSLTNPIIAMNFAVAKVKQQTLIRAALTVFLIIGLYNAVPHGIEFAALVVLGFNILIFIGSYLLLQSYSTFTWTMLTLYIAPACLGSAIMYLSIYLVQHYIVFPEIWQLLVTSIIVGVLSYAICVFVLPFKQLLFIRKKVNNTLLSLVKKSSLKMSK
jgi:PST family polysaccharide transporter